MYSLSFFKNFGSTEPYKIEKTTMNNFIMIAAKMNITTKFEKDVDFSYQFNKISFVQNISTKVLTDNEKNEITIKNALNKVTQENVDEMANTIFQIMEPTTFKIIFDISSKNKFFSSIYSKIIVILCKNDEFRNYVLDQLEKITTIFDDIQYNDEYSNNKKLDEREASVCFYTNLYINKLVRRKSIEEFGSFLLARVESFLEIETKKGELEELLNLVYLILSMTTITINKNIIEKISQSTNKTFKSVSNKSIFKCMDIMELN